MASLPIQPEVRTIRLRFCDLDFGEWGACTRFRDGSQWGAEPHDAPHYHHLAYRYGHEGDTLAYAQAHELCHHVVAEAFGSHSLVIFALAHGERPTPMVAAAEEALAMALHRYAMTGEHPMVDCVDWQRLKARFLEMWI